MRRQLRILCRRMRHPLRKPRRIPALISKGNGRGGGIHPSPALITLTVALLLPLTVISMFEARLRPLIMQIAGTQAQTQLLRTIEEIAESELGTLGADYSDFVRIERSADGTINALTANVAAINSLRSALIVRMTDLLRDVDISSVSVPVGALFGSELLWAKGPSVSVRSMSVGTVSAEFESRFTSAGINQTRHQILLHIHAPVTIFLPGRAKDIPVATTLTVAETVIVGEVPETFLQFPADFTK